jgi:arabinogalactan oligomer/maltooligosaccharide transport system substrate-binding protein
MKRSKLFVLMLVASLVLSGISQVFAQDKMAPVKLTIWSQEDPARETALQTLFNTWADANAPGSTVDIVHKETETQRNDLLTAGLAGSGLPDVVFGPNDAIGVYVDAGLLQPLDDLFDVTAYNTNPGMVGDELYGVPTDFGNHLMLMYNKTLVPTPPDTFEDLVKVAKQVETDNPGVHGFDYNQTEPFWFLAFVHGFGGNTFDADGNLKLDSQEWIDAYQFVHDLKFGDNAVLSPEGCDYNCADGAFKEGKTAMIINGIWAVGGYLDATASPALGPDNFGVAPWPKLPNGERPAPFTGSKVMSIPVSVTGDQLDAVVSFVTWLTTDPEAVKAFTLDTGNLPAVDSVKPDPKENPILAAAAELRSPGVATPTNTLLRCMWDSVRPNLEGVMSDSMTAADAASEAQLSAEDCAASGSS